MPTTEHTINDAIAGILRETRHAWKNSDVVTSENTGMLKGNSFHLTAAEGWFELGDLVSASNELEEISAEDRAHPAVGLCGSRNKASIGGLYSPL